MATILHTRPPHGVSRVLFRLPIGLYRVGLGRLLDHLFVEITHTGRKSGLPRHTVLEVVRYDPATRTCIVVSGWGTQADWVQNVRQTPQVEVNLGGRRWPAVATILEPAAGAAELRDYARRHPWRARMLFRLMGGAGAAGRDALVRRVVVVALRPQTHPSG